MSFLRYNPHLRARVIAGDEPAWLVRHPRRVYIMQVLLSRPPWVSAAALNRFEKRRRQLERITGCPHVVDHLVPLSHPRVCGLTVPWNLAVTTRAANARKNNAWCEWHGELFSEPEQFPLPLGGAPGAAQA